jgi:hypothetical protein
LKATFGDDSDDATLVKIYGASQKESAKGRDRA